MLQYSGWHGTTNKRKEKILSAGFSYEKYKPGIHKQRHPNDLGNGIYFFLKILVKRLLLLMSQSISHLN